MREQRNINNPVEILLNKYNIPQSSLENIQVSPKIVAALAHISHTHSEIIASSLFGSRVDPKKQVTENRGENFLIRLDDSYDDCWGEICYDIILNLERVIGEYKIEDIDMCVYNNDNEDPLFKKHVLSQSFMLKGTKNELKK